MYFDFTANLLDDAIKACIQAVGTKRLIFGSDLPIAIMLDTKGPEYRIKTFKEGKIFLNEV